MGLGKVAMPREFRVEYRQASVCSTHFETDWNVAWLIAGCLIQHLHKPTCWDKYIKSRQTAKLKRIFSHLALQIISSRIYLRERCRLKVTNCIKDCVIWSSVSRTDWYISLLFLELVCDFTVLFIMCLITVIDMTSMGFTVIMQHIRERWFFSSFFNKYHSSSWQSLAYVCPQQLL